MFPSIVKITKKASRHVINIPVKLARETGIDKAEYVLITKLGEKKLEVKRYDSENDIAEYIKNQVDDLNKSTKKGKGKKK